MHVQGTSQVEKVPRGTPTQRQVVLFRNISPLIVPGDLNEVEAPFVGINLLSSSHEASSRLRVATYVSFFVCFFLVGTHVAADTPALSTVNQYVSFQRLAFQCITDKGVRNGDRLGDLHEFTLPSQVHDLRRSLIELQDCLYIFRDAVPYEGERDRWQEAAAAVHALSTCIGTFQDLQRFLDFGANVTIDDIVQKRNMCLQILLQEGEVLSSEFMITLGLQAFSATSMTTPCNRKRARFYWDSPDNLLNVPRVGDSLCPVDNRIVTPLNYISGFRNLSNLLLIAFKDLLRRWPVVEGFDSIIPEKFHADFHDFRKRIRMISLLTRAYFPSLDERTINVLSSLYDRLGTLNDEVFELYFVRERNATSAVMLEHTIELQWQYLKQSIRENETYIRNSTLQIVESVAEEQQKEYVIVVDAGSSGSRMFLYSFKTCMAGSCPYRFVQSSVTFPVVEFVAKSVGGIHERGSSVLVPLLASVMEFLHERGIEAVVPLWLCGTGGIRSLDKSKQESLLTDIKKLIKAPLEWRGGGALEPQDEARFDFLSANGVLDQWPPVNSLDLGGVSVQISYWPDNERDQWTESSKPLPLATIFSGVTSRSFPNLGREDALQTVTTQLFERQKRNEQLFHPCFLPKKGSYTFPLKTTVVEVQGTGSFEQCLFLAEALIEQRDDLRAFVKTADYSRTNFAFFPAYFVDFARKLQKTHHMGRGKQSDLFTVQMVAKEGKRMCSRSWEDIQTTYPEESEYYLVRYCWMSTYMTALLAALGLQGGSESVVFLNTLPNTTIPMSFAHGAAWYYASQMQSHRSSLADISALPMEHSSAWRLVLGGSFLMAIVSIALVCRYTWRKHPQASVPSLPTASSLLMEDIAYRHQSPSAHQYHSTQQQHRNYHALARAVE